MAKSLRQLMNSSTVSMNTFITAIMKGLFLNWKWARYNTELIFLQVNIFCLIFWVHFTSYRCEYHIVFVIPCRMCYTVLVIHLECLRFGVFITVARLQFYFTQKWVFCLHHRLSPSLEPLARRVVSGMTKKQLPFWQLPVLIKDFYCFV